MAKFGKQPANIVRELVHDQGDRGDQRLWEEGRSEGISDRKVFWQTKQQHVQDSLLLILQLLLLLLLLLLLPPILILMLLYQGPKSGLANRLGACAGWSNTAKNYYCQYYYYHCIRDQKVHWQTDQLHCRMSTTTTTTNSSSTSTVSGTEKCTVQDGWPVVKRRIVSCIKKPLN